MSVKNPATKKPARNAGNTANRPLNWRGFGGGPVTLNSVEFDKQLDKISQWIENWDHNTRCQILEVLLRQSNYTQIQFLWTVMQPAAHRDFMYTASKDFPNQPFIPISTHASRELKEKLIRANKDKYHRVKSAYFQKFEQVKLVTQEIDDEGQGYSQTPNDFECRLPGLPQLPPTPMGPSRQSIGTHLINTPENLLRLYNATPATPEKSSRTSFIKGALFQSRDGTRMTNYSPQKSFATGSMTIPSVSPTKSFCGGCMSPEKMKYKADASKPSRTQSQGHCNTMCSHGSPRYVIFPIRSPRPESLPAILFDHGTHSALDKLHSAPPCVRFVEMPVRRHMQEEDELSHQRAMPMANTQRASFIPQEPFIPSVNLHGDGEGAKSKSDVANLPSEAQDLIRLFTRFWSDLQRNEFLHKLLLKLDPRQHYFITSFLSVKRHIDILGLLPIHIALKILIHLTPRQLLRISRVSWTWYRLCNHNDLWKQKCHEVKLIMPIPEKTPNWKDIFRENQNLNSNWDSGTAKVVECFGHTDKVLSLTLQGDRMATGSSDRTIRIWDVQDGRCLLVLKGHSKGIWCLRFYANNLLISASYDHTIRVWNLRDGHCIRTMLGHSGPVWAIVLRNSIVASASQDKTAKLWDISRCSLLHTLKGHHSAVFCVDMNEDGQLVITGSADKSIRLWRASSGTQVKVIWVPQGSSIMAVSYSHGWIACAHSNLVCVYRLDRPKMVRCYAEHTKRIESLTLRISTDPKNPEGHIVSAGQDGQIKYWDITKKKSVQTFPVTQAAINCIHFDATRIATASFDNKIKIMDFTIIPETDDDDDYWD